MLPLLTDLGAALYPPLCWLCRDRLSVDGFGCAEHALDPAGFDPGEARCSGCAERLPAGMQEGLCARCRRQPRGYRRLVAYGSYREGGALREWILAFKHGGRRELARPLSVLLARAWTTQKCPSRAVLVSVPLHPLRLAERGYDQARLLGEELAGLLGLRHFRALRRRRWTPAQGAPGARSRAANVAGAFALVGRRAHDLAGRSVWLLDDVVASGATVKACAEELRRADPAEVSVIALCRAERASGDSEASPGAEVEGRWPRDAG